MKVNDYIDHTLLKATATKDEIIKWANCCMDFVYNDIGYNCRDYTKN